MVNKKKNRQKKGGRPIKSVRKDGGKAARLRQRALGLFMQQRHGEAEQLYEALLASVPGHIDDHFNLGNIYYSRLKFDQAMTRFEYLYEKDPKNTEVRKYLFAVVRDGGRLERMMELAEEFHRAPLNESETVLAFLAFATVCDWPKMVVLRDVCIESLLNGRASEKMLSGFCLDVMGMHDVSLETRLSLSCKTGTSLRGEQAPHPDKVAALAVSSPPPTGRLRIGYVSGDFECHPVGYFIYPVVGTHDRHRFEVFCYSGGHKKDHIYRKFTRVAEHFIDVSNMSKYQVAQRVREDRIDVLVDLGGHTSSTLLSVLLYRAAPVQMTYLGFASTTGVAEVDFRVTDQFADDENAQKFYTEQLLRLPACFVCFGMRPSCARSKEPPFQRNGYITFGSFNNKRKLNSEVVGVWSRILHRVPESKLALKTSWADAVVNNLLQAFSQHGIEKDRLVFFNWTDGYDQHVDLYNKIDIALDTFPYTGTTTTCEALWMGVPVVTVVGNSHASRVSYSILKNIGYEETLAFSEDQYVEKAVELADKPEGLGVLRSSLQMLFDLSPVAQPDRFVPQLEAIYMEACRKKDIDLSGLISDAEVAEKVTEQAAHPFAALPGDARFRDLMVAEGGVAGIRSMVDQCLQRRDPWQTMAVVVPAGRWQGEVADYLKLVNTQQNREFVVLTFDDDLSLARHAAALVEVCGVLHWLRSNKEKKNTDLLFKEASQQQRAMQGYLSRWLLYVDRIDDGVFRMMEHFMSLPFSEDEPAPDAVLAIPLCDTQSEIVSHYQNFLSRELAARQQGKRAIQMLSQLPGIDSDLFFRDAMSVCGSFHAPDTNVTSAQETATLMAEKMGLLPSIS